MTAFRWVVAALLVSIAPVPLLAVVLVSLGDLRDQVPAYAIWLLLYSAVGMVAAAVHFAKLDNAAP